MVHILSSRLRFVYWVIGLIAGYVLATAIIHYTYHVGGQSDMTAGWLLAVVMHLVGLATFRQSIGQSATRFLTLAIGGIFIRLFVLIIFFVIVLVGGFLQAGPFIIGLLTAYFIGSWMEITWLVLNQSNKTGL